MASPRKRTKKSADVQQFPRVIISATLELISWLIQVADTAKEAEQQERESTQETYHEANKSR
jgi:hypothetical protein